MRDAVHGTADVLPVALLPDVVTAHCLWCPGVVRGFHPVDVHDRMEIHYAGEHSEQIAAALDLLR